MKNISILILSFLCIGNCYSQNITCGDAIPACAEDINEFPASTNAAPAEAGPDYDCLFTQPNPAWYFMQIGNDGDIVVTIDTDPLVDVDFICWGPFTDEEACDDLTLANVEDCSYAGGTFTEVCDITGAVAGEYYMFLITNFSNQPTLITFEETNTGTGSIDCVECNSNISAIDLNCYESQDGEISFSIETVIPGTTIFDIEYELFLNGVSQQTTSNTTGNVTFTNLEAGDYTVEATLYTIDADPDPCFQTANITVAQPDEITINSNFTNVLCFNGSDGTIDYIITGGTLPLAYTFNGIPTANTSFSGLSSSFNNFQVTDNNACVLSATGVTISSPAQPISITETISPVSCFGFSDGAINLSTNGGTPGYNFVWTSTNPINGNGTNTITNLETGNYSVNITDLNGCPLTSSFFVDQSSLLDISTIQSNYNGFNIRCNSGSDGWVSTVTTGGTLPYTYEWTDINTASVVSNNQDLYNISASQYQLIITDAQGCPSGLIIDLNEPDSISLDISDYAHKSCTYNDDGFIEVVSWGGPDSPVGSENYFPYNYSWKGPNSFFSFDKNIYNLSEGRYNLILEDINNCTNEISFEIIQNEEIIAGYRILEDTISINYPNVNLFDNSSGEINSWEWEFSNGINYTSEDVIGMDLSVDLSEIGKMYYDLTHIVTDVYGCSDTTTGRIAVKDEHTLYVPNAFTPDFDGINDSFRLFHHAMNTESFSISIFDRYGSLVFTSEDPDLEWDGKNQITGNEIITGSYSYSLSYKDFEGRIYDYTNCANCKGTISIIR
jgi:large repetitive protein